MSIFKVSDYKSQTKNQKVYSKKNKIPTQMRSYKIKCSIAKCREHAPFPVIISVTQTFNLCREHYITHTGKDDKYAAVYKKASKL